MKIKVKHVLLFIIVSITIMSFTIYNIVINNDVYEEVDSRNIINNKLISLMIEETRGSGVYKVSKDNKWPSKKYIFFLVETAKLFSFVFVLLFISE